MFKFEVPTLGWLTSILLTLFTVFVFGTLQNYGPESTVSKFHQAAKELDRETAAELMSPGIDSAASQELWRFFAGLMANGRAEYRIVHYERKANQAAIVVRYGFPNGEQINLIWVVKRRQGRWLIDSEETALAARYLLNRR
jgi:hypothetical protein